MLSLEILMMIISSILFVSNDSVISENKLMLTILLLQECGMTREENLAIASTAVNTAKYKNLTIKQLLQDGESHWIYNQRVLKRIPDLDNLCKSILDALNGLAYNDDSQICHLILSKEYGYRPRTVITISEI